MKTGSWKIYGTVMRLLWINPTATVEKEDIITIDYAELDDEGNEIEGTKREGFVFTVGSGYNLHKIDDDVIGMKKDETKVIEKEYPEDFEVRILGRGKRVKLQGHRYRGQGKRSFPNLDDELAQDVSEEVRNTRRS